MGILTVQIQPFLDTLRPDALLLQIRTKVRCSTYLRAVLADEQALLGNDQVVSAPLQTIAASR